MTETTTATKATFTVPAGNLAKLTERLDKLNRRAKKLGCEPICWSGEHAYYAHEAYSRDEHDRREHRVLVTEENLEHFKTLPNVRLTGALVQFFNFTVTGQSPSLNGWTFVATLEPVNTDEGTVNIIKSAPGQTCPVTYKDKVGHCDHCNTHRRRNQTFVVRHEDGTTKCVGRQCLKDFLGYNADPAALAGQAEWLCEIGEACNAAQDEGWLGGGYQPCCWDLEVFLAWTAGMIDAYGWLGRGKAYEEGIDRSHCTADKVVLALCPPRNPSKEYADWKAKATPTKDHEELAAKVVAWARELPDSDNEYLTNLKTIAKAGYANTKFDGLAASMVVAYRRATEQEIARKAPKPPSNHVGTIGKRVDLVVTCHAVIARESEWGTTGIHRLTDAGGNDLVWFASGSTSWLKEGETVAVKATIKGHGEFNGRKQTVVSRVTIKKSK